MSLCQVCREALQYFPTGDETSRYLKSDTNKDDGDTGDNSDSSDHSDDSNDSDDSDEVKPITITRGAPLQSQTWHRYQYLGRFPEEETFIEWKTEDKLLMHGSWEALIASLDLDCPICWTLWRSLRSSPTTKPVDEPLPGFRAEFTTIEYEPAYAKYVVSIKAVDNNNPYLLEMQVTVWKTTEQCFLDLEKKDPIPATPTPESTAEAINRWIDVCDSQHSACRKRCSPHNGNVMPTRLLDLGDSDSTTWNLWKTDTCVSYIALSHRWSKNTPTLSRDNYYAYLRPQSDQVLPQSYQDVTAVCRAISIRYLWIDSLCIIQDDDGTEFRKEAPLMTDIYANAFLTLTICWDAEDRGIFHECRPRSISRPGRVASLLEDNWKENNHTISHESDFVLLQEIEPNDFQTCVNYADINRRAWVVQERLLSRRILYLSNDQLYWECDDCVANQASPLGIYHIQKRESIPSLVGEERDRPWSLTLETYTSCDLTYEEDRLVALAGLVKAISISTGATFFAGIWLKTWMQDLLWAPKTPKHVIFGGRPGDKWTVHKRSNLPTPTWSWLDYPGTIITGESNTGLGPRIPTATPHTYESKSFRPLAMLCRTTMLPEGIDPYAGFDKAVLEIRCLLIPMKLFAVSDMEFPPESYRWDQDTTIQDDNSIEYLGLRPDSEWREIQFLFEFSRPIHSPNRLFLLPLYIAEAGVSGDGEVSKGIIVTESIDAKEREFTRVGTWLEGFRTPSQIISMIRNTIIEQGIGADAATSFTEQERVFDSKLRSYSVDCSSSDVTRHTGIVPDAGSGSVVSDEELGKTRSKHSSLPHFSKAEWTTVSLV